MALAAIAAVLGCSQRSESQADEDEPGYPLVGKIVAIQKERGALTVAHEDIPGFMPAMTMDFKVDPTELEAAKVGAAIQARLVREEDGAFKLIRIWPIDGGQAKELKRDAESLKRTMERLPSGRYLGPDDRAPEFTLIDQNGELLSVERLRGKAFVMNFIFTRCPDPTMCSLSTSKMARLQKMATKAGIENVAFISVTLDPEYDTPAVLKQYGRSYGIDDANFHLATGPKGAVEALTKGLGVTSMKNDETILHSLATSLVGPDGTILLRSERSDWSPDAFLEKLKEL